LHHHFFNQNSNAVIFPCEKAVWYYLPQIRADLAIELVATGMTQSSAAKKLGVTPAAISQYIHKKRGMQPNKSAEYLAQIKQAVAVICKGTAPADLQRLVCSCCHLLQKASDEHAEACGGGQD
jgi:predicted transcriptional regulator